MNLQRKSAKSGSSFLSQVLHDGLYCGHALRQPSYAVIAQKGRKNPHHRPVTDAMQDRSIFSVLTGKRVGSPNSSRLLCLR